MYCKKCGKRLSSGNSRCPYCGVDNNASSKDPDCFRNIGDLVQGDDMSSKNRSMNESDSVEHGESTGNKDADCFQKIHNLDTARPSWKPDPFTRITDISSNDNSEAIPPEPDDDPMPGREDPKPAFRWKRWMTVAACAVVLLFAAFHPFGGKSTDQPPTIATNNPEENRSYIQSASDEQYASRLVEMINKYEGEVTDEEYEPTRVLVSCDDSVDFKNFGAVEVLASPDGIYVLQFENSSDAEEACRKLSNHENVKWAELDGLISADDTGSAGTKPVSWGTEAIGADVFARALSQRPYNSVTVAVVDSGISAHEMLNERLIVGLDFQDDDSDTTDLNGHGTHVAGIIVDATPQLDVNIMPIRVLNRFGKCNDSILSLGIKYAVGRGADVINLSLGGAQSEIVDEAVQYALEKGVIIVAAAGNESQRTEGRCPAHIEDCITVSAIEESYKIWAGSNFGYHIDFCAPGVDISSSVPDSKGISSKYQSNTGTSMATPYISAMAAMLKAAGLANTSKEVEQILCSCVLDLGNTGWDVYYGFGLPQISQLTYLLYDIQEDELFNETYWSWNCGPTLGSNYVMKFHADGTYECICIGSGNYETGTYSFRNGTLTIDGNVYDYHESWFVSRYEYEHAMEENPIHYFIEPDYESTWQEYYQRYLSLYVTPETEAETEPQSRHYAEAYTGDGTYAYALADYPYFDGIYFHVHVRGPFQEVSYWAQNQYESTLAGISYTSDTGTDIYMVEYVDSVQKNANGTYSVFTRAVDNRCSSTYLIDGGTVTFTTSSGETYSGFDMRICYMERMCLEFAENCVCYDDRLGERAAISREDALQIIEYGDTFSGNLFEVTITTANGKITELLLPYAP